MRNHTCIFHTGSCWLIRALLNTEQRQTDYRKLQPVSVSEVKKKKKNETLKERLKPCDLCRYVKGRLNTARKISATGLLYYQCRPPEGAYRLLSACSWRLTCGRSNQKQILDHDIMKGNKRRGEWALSLMEEWSGCPEWKSVQEEKLLMQRGEKEEVGEQRERESGKEEGIGGWKVDQLQNKPVNNPVTHSHCNWDPMGRPSNKV